MCAAVACFAMLDTTAKYLNLYMNTLQIVSARYTGAFLFPFIVSNPSRRPGSTRPRGRCCRSNGRCCCSDRLCDSAALRFLQLDEAIALVFSTPFFVAALSGPMLGEWVRWRRWAAIAVGFVGARAERGSRSLPRFLRALFHHHPHSARTDSSVLHLVLFEETSPPWRGSRGSVCVDDAERRPS